jgi:hypothetical protein
MLCPQSAGIIADGLLLVRSDMIDKGELAKVYVKAQADGTDDSIAVLEPHLADDVLLTMALGPVDGKQAVLTQM